MLLSFSSGQTGLIKPFNAEIPNSKGIPMATLSLFPTFLSISSHRFSLYQNKRQPLNWKWSSTEYPIQRRPFTLYASSANRKPRVRRKVKGNEELCSDIRKFVSVVGLPEGHVPSIKELSEHGRNDLANIIRRRGYKFITELLTISTRTDTNVEQSANANQNEVGDDKKNLTECQDEKVSNLVEDETLSTNFIKTEIFPATLDHSTSLETDATSFLKEHELRNEEVNNVVEEDYPITSYTSIDANDHICIEEISMGTLTSNKEELHMGEEISLSTSDPLIESSQENSFEEPSCTSSLEQNSLFISENQNEKVSSMSENTIVSPNASGTTETYINNQNGGLLLQPDNHNLMYGESSATSDIEEKVTSSIQNGNSDHFEDNYSAVISGSYGEKDSEHIETEDYTDKDHSQQDYRSHKLTPGLTTEKLKDSNPAAKLNQPPWYNPKVKDAGFHNESRLQTVRRNNKDEINRLKFLLHQKELELSRLKMQIEKEKATLSVAQIEAEKEIVNAQQLITEKDSELDASEESLSGLQEVEIQYSGEGEVVELAGSFNGWHHRIKMDPQSSSIIEALGSRNRLWSTVLWLYPGTYEIKFIVDGEWRIDHQRESVTTRHNTNNILQVDR